MIELEHGIPMPEAGNRVTKYPFRIMEVGDSFVISITKQNSISAQMSLNRKIDSNKKFITRKINDGELRVWRIQ